MVFTYILSILGYLPLLRFCVLRKETTRKPPV